MDQSAGGVTETGSAPEQAAALRSIESYFARHGKFQLIAADAAGKAIALTGYVYRTAHQVQATGYAERCWADILDHIEVSIVAFVVWKPTQYAIVAFLLLGAVWSATAVVLRDYYLTAAFTTLILVTVLFVRLRNVMSAERPR